MPGLRFLTDDELMKRCNFALINVDDLAACELFAEMQRRDKIEQANLKTIDGRNSNHV